MESTKVGQASEPGEYDEGMQALLQIIWGDGFLSPGGPAEVARLLEGSDIRGCSVLDIGCGLGAIDELLVTNYHAESVVGIDVDPTLVAAMQARIERAQLGGRIRGMTVSGGPLPFADASFDVVFSKDSGADPRQGGDLRGGPASAQARRAIHCQRLVARRRRRLFC
jgi:phosphoethanolamine N-methyltransferase